MNVWHGQLILLNYSRQTTHAGLVCTCFRCCYWPRLVEILHDIKTEPLHPNISHPGVKNRYSTIYPGVGKFSVVAMAILCRSRVADFRLVLLLAIASVYSRVCLCLPWFYLVYLHRLVHSRQTIKPTKTTIVVVLNRR